MGSLEEGGNAHVGLMELKVNSWLSLRICANYLMFVCLGSVTGTNPESQSLPPPWSHSAWTVLSTECQGLGDICHQKHVSDWHRGKDLQQEPLPDDCPLQKIPDCSSWASLLHFTDGHWWGHCLLPAPLLTQCSLLFTPPSPLLGSSIPFLPRAQRLELHHVPTPEWKGHFQTWHCELISSCCSFSSPFTHPSLDLEGFRVRDWFLLSGLGE